MQRQFKMRCHVMHHNSDPRGAPVLSDIMVALAVALRELPLDTSTCDAIVAAASSFTGLTKPEVHDRLKSLGVSKIGLRQKVVIAVEQASAAPAELAAAATLRASLAARDSSLAPHIDTLCAHVDELIAASPKELHELIKSCGVRALGLRQQVVIALQPQLPPAPPKPAPPKPAPPKPPPQPTAPRATAREDELEPQDGDDDDDDDDGLALEENAGDCGGDDDDDDGLALEDNLGGDGDGDGSDDDDDDGLALEENADEDDGFLLIEANDCADKTSTTTPAVAPRFPPTSDPLLELVPPPWLPWTNPGSYAKKPEDPVEAAMIAGINGSSGIKRHMLVDELLTLKTTFQPNEPIDKMRYQTALDACALASPTTHRRRPTLHLCTHRPRALRIQVCAPVPRLHRTGAHRPSLSRHHRRVRQGHWRPTQAKGAPPWRLHWGGLRLFDARGHDTRDDARRVGVARAACMLPRHGVIRRGPLRRKGGRAGRVG